MESPPRLWKKESNNADAMFIKLFDRNESELPKLAPKSNSISDEHLHAAEIKVNSRSPLEALDICNQALCFAEPNTENVSKSFALRSKCFLGMGKFDECLTDIDLALADTSLKDLRTELVKRQRRCIALMNATKLRESKIARNLSFKPNKHFPTFANVLDVKTNADFGRHVVAKCDIPIGKIVVIEDLFVSCKSIGTIKCCDTCQALHKNFIACDNCTGAIFCNDECKKRNLHHAFECGLKLDHIKRNQLIVRSILIALNLFGTIDELIKFVGEFIEKPLQLPSFDIGKKFDYYLFSTLFAHYSEGLVQQQVEDAANVAYQTLLDLPSVRKLITIEHQERFLMHLALKNAMICLKNGFELNIAGIQTFTLNTTLSLFNNSCAPNVRNVVENDTEYGFTVKPIKKGEQLFISYIKRELPTEIRQLTLKLTYGFDCRCNKCEPRFKASDRQMMKSDQLYIYLMGNSVNLFMGLMDPSKMRQMKLKCEQFLTKYGHLPWCMEIEAIQDIYKYVF